MVFKISKVRVFSITVAVLTLALAAAINTQSITVGTPVGNNTPLPIIMYHQITLHPNRANKFTVTLEQLEKDFAYIKSQGYTTITVKDLTDWVENGKKLPAKPVMLTFDDGYETAYTLLLPLLQKYEMKAVVSIIGSAVDLFTEKVDHNTSYSHLTWEEVDSLVSSKYVEVQNHTYNLHSKKNGRKGLRRKSGENAETYRKLLEEDLNLLQDKLADRTGYLSTAVAYPFGEYSRETPQIIKSLGYKAAFICEEKLNYLDLDTADTWLFRLRRFNRASGKSSEDFFKTILR